MVGIVIVSSPGGVEPSLKDVEAQSRPITRINIHTLITSHTNTNNNK